jgi:hypothetical protein
MGDIRSAYNILAGKSEVQRPPWRRGGRWEDNNKMDLVEMECENVE